MVCGAAPESELLTTAQLQGGEQYPEELWRETGEHAVEALSLLLENRTVSILPVREGDTKLPDYEAFSLTASLTA